MSGKYIFVGLSVSLAAFTGYDCEEVCTWDAVKTEICAIHSSELGDDLHILLAVDEMGWCDMVSISCPGAGCALELKGWQLRCGRVRNGEER